MPDTTVFAGERPASLPTRIWTAFWKPTGTRSQSRVAPFKNMPLTEGDGRELAIAMLGQALSVGPNAANIKSELRNGAPQNNFVAGYLWMVREANNPKFEAGFCAVLSDALAKAAVDGKLAAECSENSNQLAPVPSIRRAA